MLYPSDIFIAARVRIVHDPDYTDANNPMSWALLTACSFLERAQAHLGIEGAMYHDPLATAVYESLEQAGGSPAQQGEA